MSFLGDFFQCGLYFAPAVTFVLMMLMDIEKTRKLFFISFSATRVIFIILYIYKVYRDFFDQPVLDEQ